MLSCNLDALPTVTLIHTFWTQMPKEFSASSAYVRCLKSRVRRYKARMCDRLNPWYCGDRFGNVSETRLVQCRLQMTTTTTTIDGVDDEQTVADVPDDVKHRYRRYKQCLAAIRKQVSYILYIV